MADAIIIRGLSKRFDEKIIFEGLSAALELGRTHVVLGPSGIGKTTLIRLLLGLEHADAGSIEHVPSPVSAVFQENRLSENLSASANVRLASSCSMSAAQEMLDKLGIESSRCAVHTLSGGQKRRVAIARALVHNAEFFVFDEALQGLDKRTKKRVADVMCGLTDGKTSLFVTHDESDVALLRQPLVWRICEENGATTIRSDNSFCES